MQSTYTTLSIEYLSAVIFLFAQRNKPSRNEPEDKGVRGAGYTPIVKENARFVKYYQVKRGVCTLLHVL